MRYSGRRYKKVIPSVKYTRHTKDCVYHSTKHTEFQKWIYFALKLYIFLHHHCYPPRMLRYTLIRKQGDDGNDLRNICHQSFIQKALIGHLRCTCGIFKAPHLNEEKVIGLRKLRFLY